MRPLTHPAEQDVTIEGILYALSDPVRMRIFFEIASGDCPKTCSAFMRIADTELPKSTLSHHFKILRESGLIRSERKGVELHNTSRCKELRPRFGEVLTAIRQTYLAEQRGKKKVRSGDKRG